MGNRAVQVATQNFIDANGDPLNGGKLKFFDVGTSNARAVFTSADKTGSTVTEVTLNTLGVPTTNVYYDGTLKIEVYDSNNVKLYEFPDNTYYVDSFPDNTLVNATDYGDGSTNSATINAAITAIGSDKRRLLIKQASWTIDADITVPTNIELEFSAGVLSTVSPGISFTINGSFIAPKMKVFTLNGTGSVTFGEGYVNSYYPEWFGFSSTETGVNNAVFLQNCIDSITSGSIILSSSSYSIDAQINLKDKVNIIGVGVDSTILDFSSSTGTFSDFACIYSAGSLGSALPSFSGNLSKGDHQITFSSDPSLSVGDVIIIYNSADSNFNAARTVYRSGEFVKVQQISGNVITTSNPLFDSYTAGSTTSIYKMTPTTNIIKNLQVKAKTNLYSIIIRYGYETFIENVKADNTNYSGLDLRQCYDSVVDGFKIHHYSTPAGNNYGLGISNSQKAIITNCSLATSRHSLTMGGGDYIGCVPNRDILVTGNEVSTLNTTAGGVLAFDMHGNCEHILINNNIINGGINIGGDFITVTSNKIRTANDSNLIFGSELHGFNLKISENSMYTAEDNPNNIGLIDFGGNGSCGTIKNDSNFIFSENKIYSDHSNHSDGIFYFYLFTRSASEKININITNNSINVPNASQSAENTIALRNASGNYFNSINISNNYLNKSSISLTEVNAEFITVRDNIVIRSGTNGIKFSDNASPNFTNSFLCFNSNKVYFSNGCGIILNGVASVNYIAEVKNNTSVNNAQTTTGSSDTDSSFYLSTLDTVFFQNNVMGDNQSTLTQSRVYAVETITNLFESNNQNINRDNLTNHNETSITYNLGTFVNRGLNTLVYDSAQPSAGAWKQGDIVIDSTPSAGNTIGWVCTTGGSPGTWKSFGTISS